MKREGQAGGDGPRDHPAFSSVIAEAQPAAGGGGPSPFSFLALILPRREWRPLLLLLPSGNCDSTLCP